MLYCTGDFVFPASKPISAECKDLLGHILVVDPAERYSIQDILVSVLPYVIHQSQCPIVSVTQCECFGGLSLSHSCSCTSHSSLHECGKTSDISKPEGAGSAALQRHPWFRQAMPAALDVDAYNEHYIRLSQAGACPLKRECSPRTHSAEACRSRSSYLLQRNSISA